MDVLDGRVVGQVDGLGDRVGHMVLPDSLHTNVSLRADGHRRAEDVGVQAMLLQDAFGAVWSLDDLLKDVSHAGVVAQFFVKRLGNRRWSVQQSGACALVVLPQHVRPPRQREVRLDAAGATGYAADRSRGSDRDNAGVPNRRQAALFESRTFILGERATLNGEVVGLVPGCALYETAHLFGQITRRLRIVG